MPALWYPHAQRRPLGEQTEPALSNPKIIVLHTMVGSLWGTDGYFMQDGYGGTESHFGVGFDGEVLQWQDLAHQADANLDGNPRCISIETSDWGEGPFGKWDTGNPALVPAWTAEQVEAIAQLVAWLCREFSIPCEPIEDSRPGRTGIGYHRQGIDNWRVDGGEKWSGSTGKVCPGDRRIAQIPEVIERARQILAGGDEEDDMPYSQAQLEAFALNGAKRAIMSLLGDWPTNGTDREDIEGVREVVTPLSSPILGPLAPSPSQGVLFTITDSEHPDRQYTVIAGQRLWLSPGEKSAMGLDGVTVMGLVAAHPLAQLPEMVRA